jgi:hypothetical protein
MDPIIKRIADLRPAEPLKTSDLLIVSQYIQGTSKVRRTTVGAIRDIVAAGIKGTSSGGGGSGSVVDPDNVKIRVENGIIQWQPEDGPWYNLISLATLRSALVPQISFFDGDGVKLEFGPVPGLSSADPNKCLVVVGGVVQQPTYSYTLDLNGGGKIIFSEAPPKTVKISVQPY